MSSNAELARLFTEMAAVMELTGENPFRIRATEKVARTLEDLTLDVSTLVDEPKRLVAIEGIGEGSAQRIVEFLRTGRIAEHDELLAKVPKGLLAVLGVPGLGPKTVKLLWEKGGVTDLASLKEALDSGTIEKLPRMGEKTVQNIRESLDFMSKSSSRMRLGEAMPLAEEIVAHLSASANVERVDFAGSLRRGRETIGDIDILASAKRPSAASKAFTSMGDVQKVLASGETKSSVRLKSGVQVDLRLVDDEAFGAALLYFTGSKEHNVALRELAVRKGYRLNEYGLFPDDDDPSPPQSRGVRPVAAAKEEDIYRKLGLPWCPPEMREDRGELALKKIPKLIELDDIKCELHAHTTASDGRLSIEELAAEAKRRGFHTIAVTDHSRSSVQANGLSPERLREHIEEIRRVAARTKGIAILAGSEVDIHADGSLDYDDDLLAELDIVVASPHASLRQEPAKATDRLVRAVKHPLVHILGHPTGRLINAREGLHPDMDKVIAAAVASNTALEINANYLRLDLRDHHVRSAVDAGALVAINTDAHSTDHFDFLRYGVMTARRGWLTGERCVNAWSSTRLREWLESKRPSARSRTVAAAGGSAKKGRSPRKARADR
ncbi:MAG: DNA polymerase/3'-5' exonuclease PolX [Phycisphaerales bacterium]|nr:DNA polymerase/3'-5' exonuclease PolX [Phycisphaerales bacterium]